MAIAVNCSDVPALDDWTKIIAVASDEELERLRQHAMGCLHQDITSQRWSPHIQAIAELKAARENL